MERLFAEVDSSLVRKEGQQSIILQAKPRGFVCENSLRNVHPHASLVFSLLRADRAVEMGHPRFTGRVRSFTSSGPLGPISCLDLACKENSRPSQPDSEVEPSKHTGRTETGGNEEFKGGRWGWRDGERPPLARACAALAVGSFTHQYTVMKLPSWAPVETER